MMEQSWHFFITFIDIVPVACQMGENFMIMIVSCLKCLCLWRMHDTQVIYGYLPEVRQSEGFEIH